LRAKLLLALGRSAWRNSNGLGAAPLLEDAISVWSENALRRTGAPILGVIGSQIRAVATGTARAPLASVRLRVLAFVVLVALLAPAGARADVRGVVGGSFRTVGCVVRDGAWTVGRTVRALFKQGPDAAGRTAHTNGRLLEANAQKNAGRVRAAAR